MNKLISIKPVPFGGELQARVTAPAERDGALPVVVFSHGYGSSMEAYGPLTDYWAAQGFAVVQPNHTHDGDPHGWRMRVDDVRRVLDQLALVEAALTLTIDRDRIAAAGHSFGGQTAGNLLGLQVRDPETGTEADLSDARVKAGVLLATAGRGADLTPYAAEHYPFMNPRFDRMRTPALVVAGDNDNSPLSTRGPEWMTDPYHLSPGPKSLLTVPGGEHSLGGIPGYDAQETTDASPERLELVRHVTLAYLKHALGVDDTDWKSADVESK